MAGCSSRCSTAKCARSCRRAISSPVPCAGWRRCRASGAAFPAGRTLPIACAWSASTPRSPDAGPVILEGGVFRCGAGAGGDHGGLCRRFAPLGFAAEAVHPCYGLAEATLFVTSQRRGEGLTAPAFDAARLAEGAAVAGTGDGMRVVACGVPAPDHGVRIRDPQTGAELPEGRIGEVLAFGPASRGATGRTPRPPPPPFRRWMATEPSARAISASCWTAASISPAAPRTSSSSGDRTSIRMTSRR